MADRLVEKAIAAVLSPVIDPWLGPSSFATGQDSGSPARCNRCAGCAARDWAWHRAHRYRRCCPTWPWNKLDDQVRDARFPLVRYGDDMLLLASSQAEAREGLKVVTEAAKQIRMDVGDAAVMSFETGFCFLGEDFGPRYPPVIDDHRIVEPATRTVYVSVPGAGVRIEAGRLVVESPDDDRGDHLLGRVRSALPLKPRVVIGRHVAQRGRLFPP
ncbi:hypothetical protein GCM10022251_81570 [Phytohabitans flavus]|uniref:Reverse transcriptase domain-containing protein n=1 Tax=Phytohabitans flavus TaxID=1076124 RepID=A0A6F8XLA0_9ACTN|nr:hypothetical protein Pflav_009930 [Phytohabitans flavus]